MNNPQLIEVSPRGRAALTVEQIAYPTATESKTALLLDLLERASLERVLVFTRTRRGAERLSHILKARAHRVNRIHAERTQPQREAALRSFKDGHISVLVATDIAARGIDIDSVSHVTLDFACGLFCAWRFIVITTGSVGLKRRLRSLGMRCAPIILTLL